MKTTEERVRKVIVDKLGVEISAVTPQKSFRKLGADSLDAVRLIMAFEEEFNLAIPDEKAEKIQTVGDAIVYVQEHVPAASLPS